MRKGGKHVVVLLAGVASLVCPATGLTQGREFSIDSHIVSTSFFHWYTADEGQKIGPWPPLEGRENWTGSVEWWKGQIKQTMRANIDILYVHLIAEMEEQRVNLFRSLAELRAEGYDVPKIAPFLDPMIIWKGQVVDLSTPEGKQELVSHYARFYGQYFAENTDESAGSYLAKVDGRLVLVTWHIGMNTSHLDTYKRDELESELAARFSAKCPEFANGIYMVTTGISMDTFRFADEKAFLFELHAYHAQKDHNGIVTAMVKPGYWDQNVRTPGFCLPRNGGVNYRNAWDEVASNEYIDRVYVESFNEYDEGSGIYAANPDGFYIHPESDNKSSDRWSASNDPYEYLKTTAEGSRRFNDAPDYAASILTHNIPSTLRPGQEYDVTVVVRNDGDVVWSRDADIKLCQKGDFSGADLEIKLWPIEASKENMELGGIYRGCPIRFNLKVTAPQQPGTYGMELGMYNGGLYFGEQLKVKVEVEKP